MFLNELRTDYARNGIAVQVRLFYEPL